MLMTVSYSFSCTKKFVLQYTVSVGIQGKNDDCRSCNYHRFWCRCWYCKSLWVSLVRAEGVFCWMLPPKSVVFPRTTSENQKPGGGIRRWTKLYEKSVHGSKFAVPWRREAWRQRPRLKEAKTAFIDAKCGAKHTVLLASLRQGKRNSPQYPHVVMVFSASPNRWTTQTRTLLVRIMYAMMLVSLNSLTKTRYGLSTMLGCSMLNLNDQATSFLRSLQLRQFGVGVSVHQGSCP